jgi:hypothetical protein
MLSFPTSNLFIEGPDCSGKTTMVYEIHKISGYRWHIHDRSQVSRKIFCEMYGRNLPTVRDDFHMEISNLNNRFIFLLPEFEVIEKRFRSRGDEIHKSVEAIRDVYSAFTNQLDEIRFYPNVIPCFSEDISYSDFAVYLDVVERCMIKEVSDQVLRFVNLNGGESYPLQFTLYDDGKFEEATQDSMNYEPESEYYEKIYKRFHKKINDELEGKNEYGRREGPESRRFVYADDSCISFIQLAIRDRVMDFHVVIRSSNTENTFEHDLKFLYYLSSTCFEMFKEHCDKARLRFNLNSAHIIR